jgi:DNA-binding CsgD family transcriptional regulator
MRGKSSALISHDLAGLLGGGFDCWILDQAGAVLDSAQNRGRSSSIGLRSGRLGFADRRIQRVLEDLLRRSPVNASERWGYVLDTGTPCLLKFVLFGKAQRQAFGGASMAVIAFDPRIKHTPSEELLHALFGLTAAEARIAVALMCGKTATEIARDRQIAVATVRTQLKHLLAKMHLNRQADAIALLQRLADFIGLHVRVVRHPPPEQDLNRLPCANSHDN